MRGCGRASVPMMRWNASAWAWGSVNRHIRSSRDSRRTVSITKAMLSMFPGKRRNIREQFSYQRFLRRCSSHLSSPHFKLIQPIPPTTKYVPNIHPWLIAVVFATAAAGVSSERSVPKNNSSCEANDNLQQNSIDNGRKSKSFPFYEFLIEQLQVVVYSEDRDAASITSDSGRNKPSGLVGLACKHCLAAQQQTQLDPNASSFPQDRRSLAKEVSTKMYNHLQTCQHCPPNTQEKLKQLQIEHHNSKTSIKTMSRDERIFFRNLWYGMGHKDMQELQPARRQHNV